MKIWNWLKSLDWSCESPQGPDAYMLHAIAVCEDNKRIAMDHAGMCDMPIDTRRIVDIDFADVEQRVLAHMSSGPDTLNASSEHYTVVVGDDEFYVVGDLESPGPGGGRAPYFVPAWLFNMEGNRCRDVEASLDRDGWDRITDQVETQIMWES
jgi:hypothetical protein